MQERAYRLWERDPSRSAEQNWFLAEAELEAEAAVARAPGPGPQIADGAGAAAGGGVVIQKYARIARSQHRLCTRGGIAGFQKHRNSSIRTAWWCFWRARSGIPAAPGRGQGSRCLQG